MGAANVNIKKLHELIETQQAVLVEYWAPWCTYCRRIGPAFDQIAEEYTDRLTVVKVSITAFDSGATIEPRFSPLR